MGLRGKIRIWKILTTMRYDRSQKGWVNKLGLPNPGIKIGLRKTKKNDILSIAAINDTDFKPLEDYPLDTHLKFKWISSLSLLKKFLQ